MSLEKVVEEALAGRPLEMKEAFEEAIQQKVVAALEAKYAEMAGLELEEDLDEEDLEESKDEDDEDDEDDDDDDDDDLDEETLEFVDSMLDEGHDLDDIIDALVEQELEEGSIKGSGTDRKAQLKKAYRAGEQKTRDFYKNKMTPAPKTKDKGIKKAFEKGTGSNDGSPAARGVDRTKAQDRLRNTEHGRSQPSDFGKTHYKTQTHASKMYALKKTKPKLPK